MPSVRSLEQSQYYGHPQNKFWPLLFALWGLQAPADYSLRVNFLKEKQIALWDVLQCCEREGSLDSKIKNPYPNNVAALLERQPEIRTVFFNSANAQTLYDRFIKKQVLRCLQYVTLPSSSPARAMKFEDKLAQWQCVRRYLESD